MSRFSKVLLLGSRGLLGSHVEAALRNKAIFPVVEPPDHRFAGGQDVRRYVLGHGPTTVINCIGYTGPNPLEHYRVNGWFPRIMGDCCQSLGILFVQVSTNAVFAPDLERRWLPSDPLDPGTPYEISKALGEDPRAYVIRASFIGASPKGHSLFDRLRKGMDYVNRRWNGVSVDTLARRIVDVVVGGDGVPTAAVEHVHSPRVSTLAEIASLMESSSTPEYESQDARLLGGGGVLPDIRDQLCGSCCWIDEGRPSPSCHRESVIR